MPCVAIKLLLYFPHCCTPHSVHLAHSANQISNSSLHLRPLSHAHSQAHARSQWHSHEQTHTKHALAVPHTQTRLHACRSQTDWFNGFQTLSDRVSHVSVRRILVALLLFRGVFSVFAARMLGPCGIWTDLTSAKETYQTNPFPGFPSWALFKAPLPVVQVRIRQSRATDEVPMNAVLVWFGKIHSWTLKTQKIEKM